MQRDTGTSPEAVILKGGTVSLCISQEALAQEQLTSWGHPLQISKALTQIFWPMAPFCCPWCMVTHIAPFWKMGSRQRWLHKQSLREVTWAESTCKLIRLCGSMTSVMRSPCFLGRKTSIVGEPHSSSAKLLVEGTAPCATSTFQGNPTATSPSQPVPALLLYLLCSLKSLKHWRLKSNIFFFSSQENHNFLPTLRWEGEGPGKRNRTQNGRGHYLAQGAG